LGAALVNSSRLSAPLLSLSSLSKLGGFPGGGGRWPPTLPMLDMDASPMLLLPPIGGDREHQGKSLVNC
jgi:hypothetical protein